MCKTLKNEKEKKNHTKNRKIKKKQKTQNLNIKLKQKQDTKKYIYKCTVSV